MKNKIKALSYIIMILLVVSVVAIGCLPRAEKPNVRNDNYGFDEDNLDGDNFGNNDLYDNNVNRNGDLYDDYDNLDRNDFVNGDYIRGERIADRVVRLNDVEAATCVIDGDNCIVGVDMNGKMKGRITESLRNKIIRSVKSADARIRNVTVSADPDILDRLDNIGKSLRRGRPISGFADEIRDITRRISPNM